MRKRGLRALLDFADTFQRQRFQSLPIALCFPRHNHQCLAVEIPAPVYATQCFDLRSSASIFTLARSVSGCSAYSCAFIEVYPGRAALSHRVMMNGGAHPLPAPSWPCMHTSETPSMVGLPAQALRVLMAVMMLERVNELRVSWCWPLRSR